MKILHVITTLDVGGAEMHLLSQVRGQCARGHEVDVLYLKGGGSLADDFRAAGAGEVRCISQGPLALPRVLRAARGRDIVHSHLLKADMLCAVAACLGGGRRRLVSGKHNDEHVLKRPWVSRVHGVLGNVPARTLVLSDHVVRFFETHGRVRPERMQRIYYGIDPAPFEAARASGARARVRAELGVGEDEVVFVCVARFAPQKAHEVLLRAFRRALDGGSSRLRLLLVGDDPFGDGRARAEALARELELEDRALFCGIRRDVPDVLAASDVFVMASRWEGLGLVFLEAMCTSLPVLATGVSAVPEVVDDGVTGVLVPPEDDAAMAAAIARLGTDAELRASMGRAGRARVDEVFGLERQVEETLAAYRAVLGRDA